MFGLKLFLLLTISSQNGFQFWRLSLFTEICEGNINKNSDLWPKAEDNSRYELGPKIGLLS